MEKVTLRNSEKVQGCAITLFDEKGKAFAQTPDGVTVNWSVEGGDTVAQVVQQGPNSLGFDITTEGDDVGVVKATAAIARADGTPILDADGNSPSIEITVTNSAPNTASVSVGTVQPE